MRIDKIVVPISIQDKLASKHRVSVEEARHTLLNRPRIRFAEKGHRADDDVYAAFGRTFDGRYLIIFFIYKRPSYTAIIVSARDMTRKEKKQYGKK